MKNKQKSFFEDSKNITKLSIILIFLILITNIKIFSTEGNSMFPAIKNGDTLIAISPFSIKENQIVVALDPYDNTNIVKRIISKGSNNLHIYDGNLYINNQYKITIENPNSFFPRLLIFNQKVIGIQTDFGWSKIPNKIYTDVAKVPEELKIYSYIKPIIYDSYYIIPKNEVFLLGDNTLPMASIDSREIGSVPVHSIKGVLLLKLTPTSP